MLARLAVTAALILLGFAHAARADGDARCLGLVAYAEAAVDGTAGMDAVMRVVRNRIADPRFPDGACAVIAQALQFQPIAQSEVLKRVVKDPEGFNIPQVMGVRTPYQRRMLLQALRMAHGGPPPGPDPTGVALYFVNPDLMDAGRCPWFAALRRTGRIGGHVFMTHYRPGEPKGPPALTCAASVV